MTREDAIIQSLLGHIEALEETIKTLEQERKSKWTPVRERLPQLKEQVLFCEKDKVFIGCMTFEYEGIPVFKHTTL